MKSIQIKKLTFEHQLHGVRRVPQSWFSAVRGLTVEGRAVVRCRWYDRTPCGHVNEISIGDWTVGAAWQHGRCPFYPIPFHRLLGVAARGMTGQVHTSAFGAGDNKVPRNGILYDRFAWLN